ncbi:hypothetical protein HY995_01760 [Candidatus Micrarchaeota archaeon]|nr:hypothetical protein [Candidatus Micrarchaeota archaeon]
MAVAFMLSANDFAIDGKTFSRIALLYFGVQAAIWIKVGVYFSLFGKGVTAAYGHLADPYALLNIYSLFLSSPAVFFDAVFHQAAHALIALCVFALARNGNNANPLPLLPLFALASLLHNVGYWFTGIFPTWQSAFLDYLMDVFLLYFFFYLFKAAGKLIPQLGKIRIPWLERSSQN